MTQHICNGRKAERGFTLVELAIVMIIIGLLIGGVLKGQELINNAQVTATASSVKAIDAAITTFRDQYAGLPGDIRTPTGRIPGCLAGTVCAAAAGNGDNFIGGSAAVAGAAVTTSGEIGSAFVQLASADLIGGVNANLTTWNNTETGPEAGAGGRWVLSYGATLTAPLCPAGTCPAAGHYITTQNNGAAVTNAVANNVILPKSAAAIDRKVDDGLPNTGSVRGAGVAGTVGGTTGCGGADASAANNQYITSTRDRACTVYARVQQ